MSFNSSIETIVAFNAGFTITDRKSGDVLLTATAEEARQIEGLVRRGELVHGTSTAMDGIAKIFPSICMGELQVDIDADNSATAIALFERLGVGLGLAKKLGVLTHEQTASAIRWSSKAENLPQIDTAAMAELSNPVLQLASMLRKMRDALSGAPTPTAPSTATVQ